VAKAKQDHSLYELARRGAELRWKELQAEASALLKHFPRLGTLAKAGRSAMRTMTAAESAAPTPRRRRKMSAAARARISAAQKRRWAAKKAADKG
jgi:hypothetical protein